MKLLHYFLTFILIFAFGFFQLIQAQNTAEILTNDDVVLMVESKLGENLIVEKVKESKGIFDVSVNGLVKLKKSGVSDQIVAAMMEKSRALRDESFVTATAQTASETQTLIESVPTIILSPKEALSSAKTIAIEKSSLNPSRQALEKELLKRKDWQKLNLNIVRYRKGADLRVEIGRVPLSLVTHRYVFRIYDNRSGTIIAAGETTSWGSLAKNLARHISQKLNGIG